MSFKGDLKNISLFDIFQTLNTNNQTGVLVLQREGVTKKILFSPQGIRMFFTKSFRPLRLGEIFVRRGLITPQDVEILLLEQKRAYRPIGQLLVEGGKVSEAEVNRVLRYHAEDEIYEIFGWNAGTFSFFDGQTVDDHGNSPLSDVVLDPSGLCLEAARRLDEIERIRQKIPTNEEFYRCSEGAGDPDPERTDRKSLAVFHALKVAYTIDDLRDIVGLSLFDVLRSMHALLEAGFVRTLSIAETIAAAREARDAGKLDRASQLFERAHLQDPGDRALLEECVDILRRIDDPARLGSHLATLGALCIAENLIEEGIGHLEQALHQEPDNFQALSALRQAFAKQDDPERAAEVSLRIARAFADRNDLDQAIEACRTGLAIAPGGIALRFYLGQVLVRADRPLEAQRELYALVEETESSRRAMRSGRAHELLQSCYRLLLKIDPKDERAHHGLDVLEKLRSVSHRRRVWVLRGAAAAAVLLLAGGVGLTMRGPDAATLYTRAMEARERGDSPGTIEHIERLLNAHPDSEEAKRAMGLRAEIEHERSAVEQERRRQEESTRREIVQEFDEMRKALEEQPFLESLSFVAPFLERLNRPDSASVRKGLVPSVQIALEAYLERVAQQFERDRQSVVLIDREFQARHETKPAAQDLKKLEERLAEVRGRRWNEVVPALFAGVAALRASPYIGDAAKAIENFRRRVEAGRSAFDVQDNLYYTVRSGRLQQEIDEAARLAQTEGAESLRNCDFANALVLYRRVITLMEGVAEERPRERYLALLAYLENSGLFRSMRDQVATIESLTAGLQEVERLRKEGAAAEAYLMLRGMVEANVLVQFERRYKMPYQVVSVPAGAQVIVNGEHVGETPAAIEVPIVEASKVVVRREGFREAESTISPLDPQLSGTLEVHLEKNTGWSRQVPGPIEAAPIAVGDLLLLASRDGNLYALRAGDGSVAWQARTKVLEGFGASPVPLGDSVLAATLDGTVHRIRLADGVIAARIALSGGVSQTPVIVGETGLFATKGGRLVAIRGDGILFDRPMSRVATTGLVSDRNRVFAGTAEGRILVFDAETGTELAPMTVANVSSFLSGLAVSDGKVVGGAEDGVIYAFDSVTGAPAWKRPTGGRPESPAVGPKGYLFVPSRDGLIHVFDPKGEKGRPYEIGPAISAAPATAGDFLYAASGATIAAFDIVGEKPWWELRIENESVVHLAVGPKHLFAVTDTGRVIALLHDSR